MTKAEGCFSLQAMYYKSLIRNIGFSFVICQNEGKLFVNALFSLFYKAAGSTVGMGTYKDNRSEKDHWRFVISFFSLLKIKIFSPLIIYFDRYPLKGDKQLSYTKWKKAIKEYKSYRNPKPSKEQLQKIADLGKNINPRVKKVHVEK